METTIRQTWMPTVAGILEIVSGVVGLLLVLWLVVAIVVLGSSPHVSWRYYSDISPMLSVAFVQAILIAIAVLAGVASILALVGGVYTIQRRKWGLALAGSIASIVASIVIWVGVPLGMTATVLTALSKNEFR